MGHFNRPPHRQKVSGRTVVSCQCRRAGGSGCQLYVVCKSGWRIRGPWNVQRRTYNIERIDSSHALKPGPAQPLPRPNLQPASRPASGKWVSAHCDGGARGNPGPAGYGALIQDADGAVLAELSEFLGIQTNNFAEYSGLLAVLDFALAHGHRRLRVVSDSELMVKQIQGRYKVKSPILRPLFDQARKKIAQLEAFEITHALRHKNKDADRLANQAMDRGMRRG